MELGLGLEGMVAKAGEGGVEEEEEEDEEAENPAS